MKRTTILAFLFLALYTLLLAYLAPLLVPQLYFAAAVLGLDHRVFEYFTEEQVKWILEHWDDPIAWAIVDKRGFVHIVGQGKIPTIVSEYYYDVVAKAQGGWYRRPVFINTSMPCTNCVFRLIINTNELIAENKLDMNCESLVVAANDTILPTLVLNCGLTETEVFFLANFTEGLNVFYVYYSPAPQYIDRMEYLLEGYVAYRRGVDFEYFINDIRIDQCYPSGYCDYYEACLCDEEHGEWSHLGAWLKKEVAKLDIKRGWYYARGRASINAVGGGFCNFCPPCGWNPCRPLDSLVGLVIGNATIGNDELLLKKTWEGEGYGFVRGLGDGVAAIVIDDRSLYYAEVGVRLDLAYGPTLPPWWYVLEYGVEEEAGPPSVTAVSRVCGDYVEEEVVIKGFPAAPPVAYQGQVGGTINTPIHWIIFENLFPSAEWPVEKGVRSYDCVFVSWGWVSEESFDPLDKNMGWQSVYGGELEITENSFVTKWVGNPAMRYSDYLPDVNGSYVFVWEVVLEHNKKRWHLVYYAEGIEVHYGEVPAHPIVSALRAFFQPIADLLRRVGEFIVNAIMSVMPPQLKQFLQGALQLLQVAAMLFSAILENMQLFGEVLKLVVFLLPAIIVALLIVDPFAVVSFFKWLFDIIARIVSFVRSLLPV